MNKKTLMLFLIIGLPLIVIIVLIAVLLSAMGASNQLPRPNTSSSVSSGQSQTSITAGAGELVNYKLAAISKDDTLVLLDDDKAQVVVQFDQRKWHHLQWQPQRKVFAVLGNTNQPGEVSLDNLFIYDPATNKTSQATTYNLTTGGITGFTWLNDSVIAFTQGEGAANWLHHYDYLNQQVTKVFQVDGIITDASNDGYVFHSGDSSVSWYSTNGSLIRRFDAGVENEDAFIVNETKFSGGQPVAVVETETDYGVYVINKDGNQPATLLLRRAVEAAKTIGVCEQNSQLLTLEAAGQTLQIFNIVRPNAAIANVNTKQENARFAVLEECSSHMYIYAYTAENEFEWFRFGAGAFQQIPAMANLIEIAAL